MNIIENKISGKRTAKRELKDPLRRQYKYRKKVVKVFISARGA